MHPSSVVANFGDGSGTKLEVLTADLDTANQAESAKGPTMLDPILPDLVSARALVSIVQYHHEEDSEGGQDEQLAI